MLGAKKNVNKNFYVAIHILINKASRTKMVQWIDSNLSDIFPSTEETNIGLLLYKNEFDNEPSYEALKNAVDEACKKLNAIIPKFVNNMETI